MIGNTNEVSSGNPMIRLNRLGLWSANNTFKTTNEDFYGKRNPSFIPGYKGNIPNRNQVGIRISEIAKKSVNKIRKINANIKNEYNPNVNPLNYAVQSGKHVKQKDEVLHQYGIGNFFNTHKSWWVI